MNTLKVSIIVNCYNQEDILAKNFDSILKQKTNFAYEIIASDDCSTDNTREVILSYQKKYPDIFKCNFEKENCIQNRKIAERSFRTISLAEGEYLSFLDGDDYWINENKLQMQADFLDNHPDFTMCFAISDYRNSKTNEHIQFFPDNLGNQKIFGLNDIIKSYFDHRSTVMYRFKKFKQFMLAHYFHKIINGDIWFRHFFTLHGPCYFMNEVVSVRTINGTNNLWTTKNTSEDERNCKYPLEIIRLPLELSKLFALFNKTYPPDRFYSAFVTVLNSAIKLQRKDVIIQIMQNYPNELLTLLYQNLQNESIKKMFFYCFFLQEAPIQKLLSTKINQEETTSVFITGKDFAPLFEQIKGLLKFKDDTIHIYCDISQLSAHDSTKLQGIAADLFDNKIDFITKKLNETAMISFFHKVQLAIFTSELTNYFQEILYLLILNKKIYIPDKNVLKLFYNNNILLYDINSLNTTDYPALKMRLPSDNTAVISALLNEELDLYWKKIFNN